MASLIRWLDRRRNPWKGEFYDAFRKWRREDGPARLYDYAGLPSGAVVFDFGGYRGEWTDMILAAQPKARVHVFEPHPGFADALRRKFVEDGRVVIHALALGSEDGMMDLSDAGDASSAVAGHGRKFQAPVVSVRRFFEEHDVPRIDLAKINIEGGEYDLVPALIEAGVITRIRRMQVQFHLFDPVLSAERDSIRARLEKTHSCTWSYPFVWEEWVRPPPG